MRLRERMVRKRRLARQQIKSFLMMHNLPQPAGLNHWTHGSIRALKDLDLSDELRLCLDMLVEEQIHADRQVRRLTEALERMAESRRHQRKVAFLRSVPGVGLNKAGNQRLRTVLIEAAWRWVGQDAAAKSQFRRYLRNTGDSRKAIVAVARKLIIVLWRLVTREQVYCAPTPG